MRAIPLVSTAARTASLLAASFAVSASLLFACAGAKPSGDAKVPDPQTAGSDASAPMDLDAGPTTTTTTTLGEGGDLQGAKLSTTTTVASTSADAGAGGGATARHGDGGASGPAPGRSAKDIQAIILARRDEARRCYDTALKDHPGIEGALVIQWTIDPKGNVTKASVDASRSTISETSVAACIIDIIKKIKFSEHPQGKETNTFYPFDFHPHTFKQ